MMMLVMLFTLTATMSAQRYQSLYSVRGEKVMFDGQTIQHADAKTFQNLGNGYAKDRNNVYLDGKILRFVDPLTFRLIGDDRQPIIDRRYDQQGPGQQGEVVSGRGHDHNHNDYYDNSRPYHAEYMITNFDVYFDGRRVEHATASSFKDLGYGYGKDSFRVYYFGQHIQSASASSFKLLTDGYAKDAFRAYYRGNIIDGASGSSFKILSDGYSKDAFNVYYQGRKVEGARSSSFKIDGKGYAHDAFDVYYYGVKTKR